MYTVASVIDTSMGLKKGLNLQPEHIEGFVMWPPIQNSKVLCVVNVVSSQRELGNEDGISFALAMINE